MGFLTRFRPSEAAPDPSERRRSIRHTSVLQIAKLVTPRAEELCIVRDVSPEGLRAEVYCRVEQGERVCIELKTGHAVRGRVMWHKDFAMGVEFDEPVPILAMLAHCSFDERLGKIRPPRLDVALAGTLRAEGEEYPIEIRNVSQAGMKVALERPLKPDTPCLLAAERLEPRRATVRWWREGECGLLLAPPISFGEFATWRRALEEVREAA